AGLVHHIAVGVGAGDDTAAVLADFLDRIDRDIAGARDGRAQTFDALAAAGEHALGEIDGAVAGRLLAGARAAIGEALAGEDACLPAVGHALVLAEQVADLPSADTNIAGRHVGVLAEVPVQLDHEGLAEAHDLALGPAARIEV